MLRWQENMAWWQWGGVSTCSCKMLLLPFWGTERKYTTRSRWRCGKNRELSLFLDHFSPSSSVHLTVICLSKLPADWIEVSVWFVPYLKGQPLSGKKISRNTAFPLGHYKDRCLVSLSWSKLMVCFNAGLVILLTLFGVFMMSNPFHIAQKIIGKKILISWYNIREHNKD